MAPSRTVHCTDGVAWLRERALPQDHAVLTSLPDASEIARLTLAEWEAWFVDAAAAVVAATHADSAAVFYQTDVKRDGLWIDKGALVLRGAQRAGGRLLWHKVVLRAQAGTATYARPGYAHLLCVSRGRTASIESATADVLPRLGGMTWARAMGLAATAAAVQWLREHAGARAIVDPFCGMGTALAVANQQGLDAIGVELAPSRAERARDLSVDALAVRDRAAQLAEAGVGNAVRAAVTRTVPALLDAAAITAALPTLPGFARDGNALRARYRFADFAAAFACMSEIAEHAEALQHHPDWTNSYARLDIALTTHDAGGITDRDVALARHVVAAAAAHGGAPA